MTIKTAFAALLALLAFTAGSPARAAEAPAAETQVLVFWADWCPSCGPVLSAMDKLKAELGDQGVRFVAVASSDTRNPAQALARKGAAGLELRTDGDELFAAYEGVGFPWVVIVDGQGKPLAMPSQTVRPGQIAQQVAFELSLL